MATLRTAGHYVSEEKDQTPHFLKFNKDGTVVSAPYKAREKRLKNQKTFFEKKLA
jgi:hypothetical protein